MLQIIQKLFVRSQLSKDLFDVPACKLGEEVAAKLAEGGMQNDLLERLAGEPLFAGVALSEFEDASRFVGRAPQQVDSFIQEVVDPIRAKYRASFPQKAELSV